MRKFKVLLLVLIFISTLIFAGNAVIFKEISKPDSISVDDNNIYITQGINVFIYSKKDMTLINKIGKEGQGPNEFAKSPRPWIPSLLFHKAGKNLLVNSIGKTSLITKDGKFLKEVKAPSLFGGFVPFGNKYIGFSRSIEEKTMYIDLNLYDSNFKKGKRVYKVKSPQQRGGKVNPIIMGQFQNFFYQYAEDNKFFLPTDDGIIHVFDINGRELPSIKPGYREVLMSKELKKTYDSFFKNDIRFKRIYTLDRKNVEFPKRLRPIKAHRIADSKIYIISNKMEKQKYESFIYSTSGKLIKKTYIQLDSKDILELYPFAINNNKTYQLVENENEDWELIIKKIVL